MAPRSSLLARLLTAASLSLPAACSGDATDRSAPGGGAGTAGVGAASGSSGAGGAGAASGSSGGGGIGASGGNPCGIPEAPKGTVPGCYVPLDLAPGLMEFCLGGKDLTKAFCTDGSFVVTKGWPTVAPCPATEFARNCEEGLRGGTVQSWPAADPCDPVAAGGASGAGGLAGSGGSLPSGQAGQAGQAPGGQAGVAGEGGSAGSAAMAGTGGAAGSPFAPTTGCAMDITLLGGVSNGNPDVLTLLTCLGKAPTPPMLSSIPGFPGMSYPISSSELQQSTEGDKVSCCYSLTYQGTSPPCGRPFFVERHERTAPLRRTVAWSA